LRVASSKNRCKLAILGQYKTELSANWSQSLSSAAIGAGSACIQLHQTPAFAELQEKLQVNIRLFDSLIRTAQHGSNRAMRSIHCGEAVQANRIAIALANLGLFTSAVFFPVVAQGKAALRITLRANMEPMLIRHFCQLVTELLCTPAGTVGD
jgi:7-keto-8-aminopelargonate synthetase-like enzyme